MLPIRKSLLVPLLLASAIAAGLTAFALAANANGDHIPDVGSIDVDANAAADGHAPEVVPQEAAEDGLATAREAADSAGGPQSGVTVESIDVPANEAAGNHPPEAVPPERRLRPHPTSAVD